MKKFKEDDFGKYKWIDTGEGAGFWSKIEEDDLAQYRVPMDCPACSTLLDPWSIEKSFHRNGVCVNCAIQYLEGRNFPEGFFKTRNDKVKFCIEQIQEKTKRIAEMSKNNNS